MRASSDIQQVALAAITDGVPLLKAFRLYRDLRIEDVAASAGVPKEDIASAEEGVGLSFDHLASIADTLGVPVEMLLWHVATAPAPAADAA